MFRKFIFRRKLKNQFKGLLVREVSSEFVVKFYVTPDISKSKIEEFLLSLPHNFEFCFFDYFHPQISDPGAYVTIQKLENTFAYMLGNHGWTDEWKSTTLSNLTDNIFKNLPYADECFEARPFTKKAIIGVRI